MPLTFLASFRNLSENPDPLDEEVFYAEDEDDAKLQALDYISRSPFELELKSIRHLDPL